MNPFWNVLVAALFRAVVVKKNYHIPLQTILIRNIIVVLAISTTILQPRLLVPIIVLHYTWHRPTQLALPHFIINEVVSNF